MGPGDAGLLIPRSPLAQHTRFHLKLVLSWIGPRTTGIVKEERSLEFTAALGPDIALTYPRTNSHSAPQRRSPEIPGHSRVSFQLRLQRKPTCS